MTHYSIAQCSIAIPPDSGGSKEQWVHLIPAGRFSGRDGRGPYRLADPQGVMEASRRRAGKAQLVVDYDHATDRAAPLGFSAVAAGWIKALQSRSDGIWGLVTWTDRASQHLAQKEYRYISPVFHYGSDGNIRELLRASLTNNPNLDMTAVCSAAGAVMDNQDFGANLRAVLGLAPEIDDASVLAKIAELMSAASQHAAGPDPSAYVPIGDFERVVSELNRVHLGVSKQAAEISVEDCIGRGKLLPALRDWGIALCTVNKPAFDAFIKKTGGMFAHLAQEQLPGPPPRGDASRTGLSEDQNAICAAMGLDPAEYAKSAGGKR